MKELEVGRRRLGDKDKNGKERGSKRREGWRGDKALVSVTPPAVSTHAQAPQSVPRSFYQQKIPDFMVGV